MPPVPRPSGETTRTARVSSLVLWATGPRSFGWALGGIAAALALMYWIVLFADTPGDFGFDFRQFWQGGRDVVEGTSPYPSTESVAAAQEGLSSDGIRGVFGFPYPAVAAVVLAPFGALPFGLASWVWAAVLVACLAAALWIVGVRDWRVAGVVATSVPVLCAVRLGTLTPVLLVLLAVTWRWRDRPWISGGSLACAVALKLFLWPVVVWLAATRRYVASLIALGGALVMTLAAWAAIGFDGLADYPELVRRLAGIVDDRGFSLVALGVEAGMSESVAGALPWMACLPLLAAVGIVARRPGRELLAFSLAVVTAIALTPVVWLHYFALLVVPLAIVLPRVAVAWTVMWVYWLIPSSDNGGELWRVVLATGLVVATVVIIASADRPEGNAEASRDERPMDGAELSKVAVATDSGG